VLAPAVGYGSCGYNGARGRPWHDAGRQKFGNQMLVAAGRARHATVSERVDRPLLMATAVPTTAMTMTAERMRILMA
jgi:hypothetical protein